MKAVLIPAMLAMLASASMAGQTFTLLDAVSTTGPGQPKSIQYENFKTFSCDVIVTGGPTAVTVRIEGNQGGSLFDPTGMATHTLTSTQLSAGIGWFSVPAMPVQKIRANLLELTGGTNPTVTVICGGV